MSSEFNENSFWEKIKKYASKIGVATLKTALILYYCFKDSDTPLQAKAIIAGALAYFISPIDAIPDIIPVIGYTDDALVLLFALVTVLIHIKPIHRQAAADKIKEWFGVEIFTKSDVSLYTRIIIINLLKLKYNLYNNESQDLKTIISFTRNEIKKIIEHQPELQKTCQSSDFIAESYKGAVKVIEHEKQFNIQFPAGCPFTTEEIFDDSFFS